MDNDNVTSPNWNTEMCKLEHEKVDEETNHQEILETKPICGFNYFENVEEQQKTIYPDSVGIMYFCNENKDITEYSNLNSLTSKHNVKFENKDVSTRRSKARYVANKDAIKERSRARYAANKDVIKERSRARYAANKDAFKELQRARYAANKDAIKERSRVRYATNKLVINERSRARYASNKDKAKVPYNVNDDINDLLRVYEARSTLEQGKVDDETKAKTKLVTNSKYRLENIEEDIIEHQTSSYIDKRKAICDTNKDIKELSKATYEQKNKAIVNERARRRYEANKDTINERKRAIYWTNQNIRERARIRYEANKDASKKRKRAVQTVNKEKTKRQYDLSKDIKDLSTAYEARNGEEIKKEEILEINTINRWEHGEEVKEPLNSWYALKRREICDTNKDIVKDLLKIRYEARNILEDQEVDKVSKEVTFETNTIYRLKNEEEIIEQQKPRNADKNKARYEKNKEIVKERSKKRYEANKEIVKERSRARYAANKDAFKEQQRARYAANREKAKARYEANKDAIREKKRVIYASNKDIVKERARRKYETNKDVIRERRKHARNGNKVKGLYEANKNITDLSKVCGSVDPEVTEKEKLELELEELYILKNVEEMKEHQKSSCVEKGKTSISDSNKDMIIDLSKLTYEAQNKLEDREIDKETKEKEFEINTVHILKNVNEISVQQKRRYNVKKKSNHKINKDIVKERNKASYEVNKEIVREQSRARYWANKDIRERARKRYEANKEVIKERSRARRAAKRLEKKAICNENVKVIEEKCEFIENFKDKVKSKRKVKVWRPDEEMALINFLKENVEYMKPTAKAFFNRFIENSGVVVADWKMVRSKLFTMRRLYNNANKWLNTVGATIADNEEIRYIVRKKCRFYYDCGEIFGSNIQPEILSDQTSNDASITIVKTENEAFEISYDKTQNISSDKTLSVSENLSSYVDKPPIRNSSDEISTTNCGEVCLRFVVSKMVQDRVEISTLGTQKRNSDTILMEKEMQLLEKQLTVQEKELEVKEKELNSQEHLKIFELDMKEKIAMAELELKYKK